MTSTSEKSVLSRSWRMADLIEGRLRQTAVYEITPRQVILTLCRLKTLNAARPVTPYCSNLFRHLSQVTRLEVKRLLTCHE